jgi:hypothetical protein
LTIIPCLNTVENSFISLLFPKSTISSMVSMLKDAGATIIVALTVATPLEKKNDTYAESV